MSDLNKASQDAVDAAANSQQLALIAAMLQAQQLAQPPVCQHPPAAPRQPSNAGKWVAAGVGGSVLLIALAISAVAVAAAVVSLTVCVVILRSVWRDVRKG